MNDPALMHATERMGDPQLATPVIKAFFDAATFTVSYVIHDPTSQRGGCA